MDGLAKEGCPKFNPLSGQRLNLEPSGWQYEILPSQLVSRFMIANQRPQVQSVASFAEVFHHIDRDVKPLVNGQILSQLNHPSVVVWATLNMY